MSIHSYARLPPCRREELVLSIIQGRHTPKEAAASFGVCKRTARKWQTRYRSEVLSGLRDRTSRPPRRPRQAPPAMDYFGERETAVLLTPLSGGPSGYRFLSTRTIFQALRALPTMANWHSCGKHREKLQRICEMLGKSNSNP